LEPPRAGIMARVSVIFFIYKYSRIKDFTNAPKLFFIIRVITRFMFI
jgi:hypothetical protein